MPMLLLPEEFLTVVLLEIIDRIVDVELRLVVQLLEGERRMKLRSALPAGDIQDQQFRPQRLEAQSASTRMGPERIEGSEI